ncbi:MAG: serine/threonine protein kinase [Gemmatimonadaceae bacterium]|nr:serine/threonine protein kinase [Gemmatimonadaceae bacterium]
MTLSDLTQIRRKLADRYDLERELGRGGMGAVYLARDRALDRLVALKILPEEFAADPALHDRFLREMRTTASFSHPNIVPVHAIEERDGVMAFAMGYVEGESLAQRVHRAGPLTVRELVRLLQDVGYALAYAHGRGVAHRDIKPDNIMIERATGRALLMDFGIARAITEPTAGGGLTRVGEVVGTPEYMSPEQASGDTVDGRSDLYSLGLVAWFAAIGRPAVTGESIQKILVKQLTEPVPAIESVRPELPDLLSAAIDRCVAKVPEARFATAEALVEAVDNSQLAGPDIPLPVRSFVSELELLSTVFFLLVLVAWTVSRAIARLGSSFDALVPVVVLVGIGLTRLLQLFSDARHLAEMGYAPDDVLKGMQGVYDERESVRQSRRANPLTQRRRRTTVRMALLMLVIAAGLIGIELVTRRKLASGAYAIPAWALVPLFTGLALTGAGIALLARTPFRAPPPERIFRRVWMGPVGRAFLRLAARGVASSAGAPLTPLGALSRSALTSPPAAITSPARAAASVSTQSPATSAHAAPAASANRVAPGRDEVAQLEARVAKLEEWRRQVEG